MNISFLTTSLEVIPQANEPQDPKLMSAGTEAVSPSEPELGKSSELSSPRALECFAMSAMVLLGQHRF